MKFLLFCLLFCASAGWANDRYTDVSGHGGGTLFDSCNGFRSFTSEIKVEEWEHYASYTITLSDKLGSEVVTMGDTITFEAAPTSNKYPEWENDPYQDDLHQFCDDNDGVCYAEHTYSSSSSGQRYLYIISSGPFWEPDSYNIFAKAKSKSGCQLTWTDVITPE